ncbi:helix-turn-helix transcriptional regulator [Rasiella rasia]|uniref:Helix-turn-helix transcriptional regulator n=1 Tax=Rasiella rasia TaxID=2744027 RepID=A0A6G6GJE2_9FLAO|nr:helix-turn-helix transcriptional regulator [Rasiella rasia]QIE58634.1 helix-turn-helix transcriptional regulator [Rasiella rasia]
MNDKLNTESSGFLTSYIKENKSKIDESLVSLRLMKEVDDFLDINCISQRSFADDIGYSEAYISQLMSGVKKFNTSFINRLEKKYNLRIEFKLNPKNECKFISKLSNTTIEFRITNFNLIQSEKNFSSNNNPLDYCQFETVED